LELCWLQRDVAKKIGISPTSISDWERGVTSPSRRMRKKVREFLDHKPIPTLKKQPFDCQLCGISETSPERCLFENVCNSLTESKM
jgi:transcriptional regulator with XRE-family HTH domain